MGALGLFLEPGGRPRGRRLDDGWGSVNGWIWLLLLVVVVGEVSAMEEEGGWSGRSHHLLASFSFLPSSVFEMMMVSMVRFESRWYET